MIDQLQLETDQHQFEYFETQLELSDVPLHVLQILHERWGYPVGGTPGGAERTASRVLRGPNKRNAAISSLVVGEVLEVRGST